MKTFLTAVLVCSLLATISIVHGLPTTGSTLSFGFDDFLQSQLSPNWNIIQNPVTLGLPVPGNVSQNSGWLTLSEQRGHLTNACSTGCPPSAVSLIANNTDPIIATTTTSQFVYMVWKMQAFNFSQTGNNPNNGLSTNAIRNAMVLFGMFNIFPGSNWQGIGFALGETDNPTKGIGLPIFPIPEKEYATVWITSPMYPHAPGQCFSINPIGILEIPNNCGVLRSGIMYTGSGAGGIDLNAVHVYTIEASFQTNATSWAAFQIDNNGWINVTQSACSCIESGANSYVNLYPYISNYYCIGTTVTACSNVAPNQSLGTSVDYVLVEDHVVTSLPSGQIIPSNISPPPSIGPLGGNGGLSLTGFLQFEANSISPGNLYAGGMLLAIIVSGTTFAVMMGISRKASISVKHAGLFFTMFVLVLSFLFFTASILPIWIPVMMTLITMGVVFGVIRTGNAGGGLVPD